MWIKVDDKLANHPKVFAAGELIGTNGAGIALGMFVWGLSYSAEYLTDGFVPAQAVKHCRHLQRPTAIACALVDAHLWDLADGGYQIHDYHDYNPHADEVQVRRERDRLRKENERRTRLGLPALFAACPHGQHSESERNPEGQALPVRAESEPCPDASRARDPVPSRPVPSQKNVRTAPSALDARFEAFWDAYPRKTAKADALKEWRRLTPSETMADLMIAAVERQKHCRQWQENVIPHARTWLHQHRWEDEVPGVAPGAVAKTFDTWMRICDVVLLDNLTVNQWFRPCSLASEDDGLITVHAPTQIIADWIPQHYSTQLAAAVKVVKPGAGVRFIAEGR